MQDKESLKEEYRLTFPNWTEEKLDQYATMMAAKYSTIKKGPDVIHLEYYGGLIDDKDIVEIEANISTQGLQLSRFDKNGVPYASIHDFTLQVALFLSDPIVQMILLGVGTNALWDSIKASSLLVWRRLKQRVWHLPENERRLKINFGLKVRIDADNFFDLKLDGEADEETTLQALDKAFELMKSMKDIQAKSRNKFFIYDKKKGWIEINVMDEIIKKAEQSSKKRK